MKLKDTGLTVQDIKDKVNKYMIETYERFDFLAETAEGMYIYDENGTPYLDFYAGIAVNNAGNRNPKVVAAVKDQVDDIMHTFNYPYTIPQALLAEKVCKTLGMDKIFYQNSGTEANEAMIKMARKYGIEKYGPNKYHIVTAKMGFHGRTFGAMSATGQPGNGCQVGFGPMTYGFSYAPYNDLEAFKNACTENTIAIMVEPVQGEGGVHPATPEFLKGLRESCVIIGRSADYILKEQKPILRIFIYSPEDVRIENVMKSHNFSAEDAKLFITEKDKRYHKRHLALTGSNRGDRHNRDMLIDSSLLGVDGTAELIEEVAKKVFHE